MKTLKSLSKTVQSAGILLILLFLLLSVSCSQEPKAVTSPNIIVIMADDLGYAEVGAYGQELIETPNIDALASNGIRST